MSSLHFAPGQQTGPSSEVKASKCSLAKSTELSQSQPAPLTTDRQAGTPTGKVQLPGKAATLQRNVALPPHHSATGPEALY